MRKGKFAVAVACLLVSSMSAMASAQTARGRANRQGLPFGPSGQQGYNQGYNPRYSQSYNQGYNPGYNQGYNNQGYNNQGYNRGQPFQQSPPGAGQAGDERYVARRISGPMQGMNSTDEQLANWLLVDNRGEIQLARMAQERASCDDVKDFAEQVIDEHAEIVELLQSFTGEGRGRPQGGQYQAASPRGRFSQPMNNRGGQNPQGYASGRGSQQGGLNLVRLKQQLGQQCVNSAEQELEQKEGDEFDKCYIGMQIAKHMEMLDTLKVFSRYASPELDELIEQAEQTTQDHLEHAKHLIKQLESDSQSDNSTRSSRSSRSREES